MKTADDRKQSAAERMFDAIDLAVAGWDAQHRLQVCNRPYERWAEQPLPQLVGRTLLQLYGETAWAAARGAFGEALAGRAASYETLLTHRAGAPRWARVKVIPGAGAEHSVYTVAFDIHDDVLQREALQDGQRRLDRFSDNIPYPLTYVDRDFVIRFVNRAYCHATGMAASELLGRHIGAVRGDKRWEEHRPYFERALGGESVQYTRMVALAGGGARWLRTSYEPDRDAHGQVLGLYTVSIDVHEMTLAQERLRRSVERDALTQVLSRRAILDRIEAAVPGAVEAPVALFFVDLDGFKEVNDTLGHREGDRVLTAVAGALQGALRVDDVVGRFGGDEFIVLARVRDHAGAHALALHLSQAVQRCSAGATGPGGVSVSIGYALAPADAQQTQRLIQRADEAMYRAKREGRNQAAHCG
jgi:diguanylate cyclase (GGDEF)-like protein/PAS domain S-box-containing protein